MIIVSDTTPFRYLIEVDTVDILATLFGQVIIPEAVAGELQHQNTPQKIKDWTAHRHCPPQANDFSSHAKALSSFAGSRRAPKTSQTKRKLMAIAPTAEQL